MKTFSYGATPDEAIKKAAKQCSTGFHMTLQNQEEWKALSAAWNQGIDSHLEALTERSQADSNTGKVVVHPEEVHVLVRRLGELDGEALWPDWNYERENNPAENLRQGILSALDIEEI